MDNWTIVTQIFFPIYIYTVTKFVNTYCAALCVHGYYSIFATLHSQYLHLLQRGVNQNINLMILFFFKFKNKTQIIYAVFWYTTIFRNVSSEIKTSLHFKIKHGQRSMLNAYDRYRSEIISAMFSQQAHLYTFQIVLKILQKLFICYLWITCVDGICACSKQLCP